MLLYFGVTPYLVFDGDNLPSKAKTEEARASRRIESKKIGLELYRAGRKNEAYQELQKAVDVTPYMARMLIEELKKLKIQYVVAPYEADSQLVYLESKGLISGILSEDSDMLVFGARRLLSKLDQHGDYIEINRSEFAACKDISLIGWTDTEFRIMCILSGCDYLDSLPKIGLKTAYRSVRRFRNIEKILRMFQFENKISVPPDYLDQFRRAELTFLHQLVFDPETRSLVHLNPLPAGMMEDLSFVGHQLEPTVAREIAAGDIDPMTKEPIEVMEARDETKPSYPERAMLVERRRTFPLSDDLKPNKRPINSYFTPKRIPLAELDINSQVSSPSPSQQRVLQQNSRRSWITSRTPSYAGSSRPQTPQHALRMPSQLSARPLQDSSAVAAHSAPPSGDQAGKKHRLCLDLDDIQSQCPSPEKRSRFFPPKKPSTFNEKLCEKKAKQADFGVFSDKIAGDLMTKDSVANSQRSVKEKGLTSSKTDSSVDFQSFSTSNGGTIADSSGETEDDVLEPGTPPSALPSREATSRFPGWLQKFRMGESQESQEGVPPTVSPYSNPRKFEEVVNYRVEQQNQNQTQSLPGNLNAFRFSGLAPQSRNPSRTPSRTPSRSTSGCSASTDSTYISSPTIMRGGSGGRMSCLQQLQYRAMTKPKPAESPKVSQTATEKVKDADREFCSELNHGSEDLIVRDSEDEEEI